MPKEIQRAVVIGAGTMGAAIAAHLGNAGVAVTLLDIVPRELTPQEAANKLTLADKAVRNRYVQQGFEAAIKSRPASFFTRDHAALVTLGNLEDDFETIKDADWVIEVIIENLEIKRQLMARIEEVRAEFNDREHKHLRDPRVRDRGRTFAGLPPAFPRDTFFQSPALP